MDATNKYDKMPTEQLLHEAIDINAELQARLRATMFVLSSVETNVHLDPRAAIQAILSQLRGKK